MKEIEKKVGQKMKEMDEKGKERRKGREQRRGSGKMGG